MTEEKKRILKLKGNKICKLISECNFAQKLDFFCCKRNILINIVDVINVNKMKSRELFIEAFFNIFIWVLQFAVVVKLSLIADFFNPQNRD